MLPKEQRTHTLIDTRVHTLTTEPSVLSIMDGLIVKIFFMLVSVYNAEKWAEN